MDQIGLSGEITVVRSRLVRDAVGFSEMVRFVPIRSAFDSRFPIRAMIRKPRFDDPHYGVSLV